MVVGSDKIDYGSFADTSPGTGTPLTTPPTIPSTTITTATAGRRGSDSEGVIIRSANSPVTYSYQQAIVHPHPRPFYHKYRSASVGDNSENILAQRLCNSNTSNNNPNTTSSPTTINANSTNNKKNSTNNKNNIKSSGIGNKLGLDNKRKDFFRGVSLSGGETGGGRQSGSPGHTIVQFESHQKTQSEGENIGSASNSSSGSSPMSTSSTDFHQRQPLLSDSKNGNSWLDTGDTHIDIDDDDISKESKRNGSIVRVDAPPLSRTDSEQSVIKRFPKEKGKTIATFFWAAFNLAFATIALALTHERRQEHAEPLPDIILDSIVPQDWALSVSEILIMISTAVTAVVIIFHKYRWIVFRRVFFLVGILYLMRSLTMFVTVVPVASRTYKCAPKSNDTSFLLIITRALRLMSGFGLSINGQQVYCGDYIYSGHTVILVSCFLIIQEYSSKRLFLFHWCSWLASLTGICMVLISRGHYTVDILIAYYVTTRLFWMYHTMANYQSLKINSQNNFLARIWWFKVFQYLEGNVGSPLPRKYGPPFRLSWFTKHVKTRRTNNRI